MGRQRRNDLGVLRHLRGILERCADVTAVAALRSRLSQSVVARLSRGERPLPELFRELEVDALVTGQLQTRDGRLRATAQVVEGGAASISTNR